MALIRSDSGCKVGWETYDDETEARARGVAVGPERLGSHEYIEDPS